MAVQGAPPDVTLYIMRAEAQMEIGRLVAEQLEAFSAHRKAIEEQSQAARMLIDRLATDADAALKRNQPACEEQITQQVGDVCAQAQTFVSTVNDKLAQIESLIAAHTLSQEAAELDLATQGAASEVRSRS